MEQNYNNTQNDWSGAFGAFKPSREAVRRSLGTLVMLAVLDILITIALSTILRAALGSSVGSAVYDVCSAIISGFFLVAQVVVYIKSVRGTRVELHEIYKSVVPFWARMILLELLVAVTIIGGLILLIVPGIIFALRLSLAPYYLVDKNLDVMDAYKASWHATKGNLGKLWGIIGVYFLMLLPILTIIGVIATVYLTFMYGAVLALYYEYLNKKKPETTKQEA